MKINKEKLFMILILFFCLLGLKSMFVIIF